MFNVMLDAKFCLSYVVTLFDINGSAEVAQSVEQRTENPCVVSSILTLGTISYDSNISIFLKFVF